MLVDQLHVRQELATASHQKHPASDQVASGSHLARIDVAHRKRAATHESSNLLAVDLVILLLASVNGFHVQGVAEHELDVLIQAKIRQPVPGEHAFGADDQVFAKSLDGLQEVGGLARTLRCNRLFPSRSRMHKYILLVCRSTPQ